MFNNQCYNIMLKSKVERIFALMAAICLIPLASCTKGSNNPYGDPVSEETEQVTPTLEVAFAFDAPEDMAMATLTFYDEGRQSISNNIVTIPETSEETVTVSFKSDLNPAYVGTRGLQNGDKNAGGLMPLTNKQVKTRAGEEIVLLVIR